MRQITTALLSFSLILSTTTAWADGQGIQQARQFTYAQGPKAFKSLRSLGITKDILGKTVNSLSRVSDSEMSAEFGQVAIFMLTLTGIDVAAHIIETVYSNKIPSAAVLYKLSSDSAEEVLQKFGENIKSSDFVAGMSFGFTAQQAAKNPTRILSALIANPAAHKQLAGLLTRSILSTSILVGWNFGSQLATEARYLIDDRSDYARASNFIGVSAGALSSILNASSENIADRRIAGMMFANVLQVLFVQQDLREQWFNNTWRTKIMTGEFATMLGAMIAAGTIGTALFPGAGTVAGAMFGVAGALIYIAIPGGFKRTLTLKLEDLREQVVVGALNENRRALRSSVQSKITKLPPMMSQKQYEALNTTGQFRLPSIPIPDADRISRLQNALAERHSLRDSEDTILLERMHTHLLGYLKSEIDYSAAETELNADFARFDDLYAKDLSALPTVLSANEPNTELTNLVNTEVSRVRIMQRFFAELRAPLLESIDQLRGPAKSEELSEDAQTIVQFVQISYARGFVETKVLNQR